MFTRAGEDPNNLKDQYITELALKKNNITKFSVTVDPASVQHIGLLEQFFEENRDQGCLFTRLKVQGF